MKTIVNLFLKTLAAGVVVLICLGFLVITGVSFIFGYLALLHEWAEYKLYGNDFDPPY